MENLLFGVQPIDPTFIASSCLTLGAVAAPASHLTASRASLFDPARTPRAGL
jgi:hypothetical protein